MSRKKAIRFVGIFVLFFIQCLAQSTSKNQHEVDVHRRQAQKFLKENRPDLAIPEFRAIAAIDPKNVDALGNLGVLLFFRGDYTSAISPLRAALKLQSSLWKIEALLGMAEKRTGDYKEARENLTKAFPKLQEEKIKIQAGMELIELYSGTGDLEKAAAVVDELSPLYPTNSDILYASYRIHSDLGMQAMLSLMMVAPNSAHMHQVIAHELTKQGDIAGAIKNYREALKIDPGTPGLHFELAELLTSSSEPGHTEAAEAEYKAALAINPFDEKSECRLGDIASSRDDPRQAREYYSQALRLRPDDSDAALGLARTLLSMNQPEKAVPILEHAVALDPTNTVAHYRLGTIYRQQGRTADANRELEEFKKYKAVREKLRDIYREMRLQPSNPAQDSTETDK